MAQEVVLALYDAWNRGELETVLGLMHPEIKTDYSAGAFPGLDEAYDGHEGARKNWRDLREPWSSLSLQVDEIRGDGDTVVTLFTFEGAGREGIVVRRQLGNVLTISDGLISRLDACANPRSAVEAAGLAE
jgi:ketosteroid isomerase-like protein